MAEDEDSAGRTPGKVWIEAPAGILEPGGPLPPVAALARFENELEWANAIFAHDAQQGATDALIVAERLCHALGRPDLAEPFRRLGTGMLTLREGKLPPIYEPKEVAKPPNKTYDDWQLIAFISAYLSNLARLKNYNKERAAKELARIIDRVGITLGQKGTSTWRAVINASEGLSYKNSPKSWRVFSEDIRANLSNVLAGCQERERLGTLLHTFERELRTYPQKVESAPSHSNGETL